MLPLFSKSLSLLKGVQQRSLDLRPRYYRTVDFFVTTLVNNCVVFRQILMCHCDMVDMVSVRA